MQLALKDDEEFNPISLADEMGAYEAMWCEQGATFKTISDRFKKHPTFLPSNFVDAETIEQFKTKVFTMLEKQSIRKLGIRLNGTYDYLSKLRDAKHPIELFYFQGEWDLASSRSIAVVGTRKPSSDGVKRTQKLVRMLVEDDFTIASGLASGVDAVAHHTAIINSGRTFAVLGTPLTENYPKENKQLQQYISENFLIVSQVPFIRYSSQSYKVNRFFFPERNKLMSALTEATIIVEAGETSGTLVQARAALDQGRKLFILESCFQNKAISWPDKFAKQGAIRVREYEDIKEHLAN